MNEERATTLVIDARGDIIVEEDLVIVEDIRHRAPEADISDRLAKAAADRWAIGIEAEAAIASDDNIRAAWAATDRNLASV